MISVRRERERLAEFGHGGVSGPEPQTLDERGALDLPRQRVLPRAFSDE
jgi:hypothetical protein